MSKINYDLSRIKALAFDIDGVLSPTTVPLGQNGLPNRMVNLKDGFAIVEGLRKGLKFVIISGARESGIGDRYRSLGIADVMMSVADKRAALQEWMTVHKIQPEEIAYAGDDVPDYEAMKVAGLRVAPRDACRDIKSVANYISPYDGGQGVARDIIEQIMRAQNLWPIP